MSKMKNRIKTKKQLITGLEKSQPKHNKKEKLFQDMGNKLERLKEKQAEYCLGWQETFDSALDIIALISSDFEILKINRAGYKNLGKKPEELMGKKCYQVVHGLDSPIDGCPCAKTLKTKTAGQGEICDHGRNYIATASPILNENSEIVAFAHTIKDITERVQAEEALKDAQNKMEQKVKERTADLMMANKQMKREVEERRQAEKALQRSESKLQKQKLVLSQKNIALREVISQIEIEKRMTKEDIRSNVEMIVFPILEKLKIEKDTIKYVNLLRHHLESVTSSYGNKIIERNFHLTPREIEICHMIKAGFANKDIAKILRISYQTVEGHRKKIRQKLGIANKGMNLNSFLKGL